ncbi:hypothetical protein ACH5RR_033826 [Cinchona calisaya]|uniref:Uncharacterized protein n=1 Tax=Cinchona calisaya TaxID=153742 RepID=A0ABD2YCP4_9GENT
MIAIAATIAGSLGFTNHDVKMAQGIVAVFGSFGRMPHWTLTSFLVFRRLCMPLASLSQIDLGISGPSYTWSSHKFFQFDLIFLPLIEFSTPFCPPGPVNALGIYPTENVLFLIIFKVSNNHFAIEPPPI